MSPETENSRMEEQTRSLGARRERKGSLPDTPRPPTIPSGTVGQGASSCAAVTLRASKVVIEGKSEERRIDFSLKGLLGRGGMGMVFSARQASLDREIAIKLKPSSPGTSSTPTSFPFTSWATPATASSSTP